MYKEIIERKKLPIVTFLLMLLCAFIYLNKFVSSTFDGNAQIIENIINSLIVVTMIFVSFVEIYKSNIRYKYSIIANQFIIHKIVRNTNVEVENVKFKDIKFIGKSCELKKKYKTLSNKKYLCSLFSSKTYCCVYSDGDKLRKFYFEPSDEFLSKAKFMMNKAEECIFPKSRMSISI